MTQQQESQPFDLMNEKLDSIIKHGEWSITPNEIYIDFKYHDSLRTMNKAELVSLKTQIITNKQQNDEQAVPFLSQLNNMKRFQAIYLLFNHKGLKLFTTIQNEKYEDLEALFSTLSEEVSFHPSKETQETFLFANKIRPQSYKIIGNLLQEYAGIGMSNKLEPFITCILGWYHPDIMNEFIDVPDNIFFDATQLGKHFCRYLQANQFESMVKRAIPDVPGSTNLLLKVQKIADKSNLIFCKVQRPAHCYHCIIPFYNQANKTNNYKLFILFCTKDREFAQILNQIPKTTESNMIQNTLFFIVHPEQLNQENSTLLHEFITTRIRTKDPDLPKVFVISSDYHFFQSPDPIDQSLYQKVTVEINDANEIEILYKLSFARSTITSYLYYSDEAGLGKTHRIQKDIYAKYAKRKEGTPKSYFIDASMKYLPHLDSSYVHFDLSPDLFDDKYEFFDTLWTYCTLQYHFYEDGTAAHQAKYAYFEVPTLTTSQIGDQPFRYQDFPILVNKMIRIKSDGRTEIIKPKEFPTEEQRSSYINFKKTFEAKELYYQFPEQVQHFCQSYFGNQSGIESVISTITNHATSLNYDYDNKTVSIDLNPLNHEEQQKIAELNNSPEITHHGLTFNIISSPINEEFITRFFSNGQSFTDKFGSSINFIIQNNSQSIEVKFSTPFHYEELLSKIYESPNSDFISHIKSIVYSIVKRNSLITLTFDKIPSEKPTLKTCFTDIEIGSNILVEGKNMAPIQFTELGKRFIYSLQFSTEANKVSILLNETQIRLSTRIQTICNSIFTSEISNVSTLLSVASKLFFSNIDGYTNHEFFPLRIQKEVSTFLEKFCEYLPDDSKSSTFIFLLLLRTCFYIYNMNSFFSKTNIKLPHSWIIISPQNLFSEINKSTKWALFYFQAHGEKELKWDDSLMLAKSQEETTDFKFILSNPDAELITVFSNSTSQIESSKFEEKSYIYFYMIKTLLLNDPTTTFSKQLDKIIAKKIPIKQPEQTDKQKAIISELYKNFIRTISDEAPGDEDHFHKLLCGDYFEDPYNLSHMSFTIPLFKRFLIVLLNVYNGQSHIFEGSTGVGKTQIVKFLENLFKLLNERTDQPQWDFRSIDCHGDLHIQDIEKIIQEHKLTDFNDHVTFFFDELNTSPASCSVINKMLNSADHYNTSYLAAINPHEKVQKSSRIISLVGITQINNVKISQLKLCHPTPKDEKDFYKIEDINKFAYNVRELDPSTKMIVLHSDPETFNSIGNTESDDNEYMPNEEKVIVRSLIDYYLIELNTQLQSYFKLKTIHLSEDAKEKLLKTARKFMLNETQRAEVSKIIAPIIEEVFTKVRQLMNLKHILAYRDVKRFMMHFINFYNKLVKDFMSSSSFDENGIESGCKNRIISTSFVLSFMLTIAFRFSNYTRIPTKEFINSKNELERAIYRHQSKNDEIKRRLKAFGLTNIDENDEYITVHIRQSLMNLIDNKLSSIKTNNSSISLPDTKNWINIVLSYSYIKFSKYIPAENVYKTRSLMIHLFAISSCYSVSKHFPKESIMPCLIIGMPGTSKTLGINLFIDHKRSKKHHSTFFSTTYLSTRASEAEGLNSNYRDCAMFLNKNANRNAISICVIDELGLANLNENRPLKLLHYYFDKGIPIKFDDNTINTLRVMSIAASNFALDYANMNRGILICTDLPSDDELIEAWAKKEINLPKHYFDNTSWDVLKELDRSGSSSFKIQGKDFLRNLWKLTYNRVRPEKIALRPLFMLFSLLNAAKPDFVSICSYLTPVLSCHPTETYQKALDLITKLQGNLQLQLPTQIETYINYSVLKQFLISWLKESRTVRSLCIRTRQYEARDYLVDLLRSVIQIINPGQTTPYEIRDLFPTDFQQTKAQAADHALKSIIQVITKSSKDNAQNNPNKKTIFLVTGNATFADGLLDLLNYSDENNVKSSQVLISRNGFSISLDEIPSNILFIFLINESDFHNRNLVDSIPLPLLDRLTQIYFDYDIKVEEQIPYPAKVKKKDIKKVQQLHNIQKDFLEELQKKINEYKTARQKTITSESVLWRRTIPSYFVKRHRISNWPPNAGDQNVRYLITDSPNFGNTNLKAINDLDNSFKSQSNKRPVLKKKPVSLYYDYEYRNAIYDTFSQNQDKKTEGIRKHLTLPKDIQDSEKSILDLMNVQPRVIVLTISPLMEPLIDSKDSDKQSSHSIKSFYDSYIPSTKQFEQNIKQLLKEHSQNRNPKDKIYIAIRMNSHFSLDHHQQIRCLLENIQNYNKDDSGQPLLDVRVAIIYHLKTNSLPFGLYPSLNWPVYWREYITNSTISTFPTDIIYQSSLFEKAFDKNRNAIFSSSVKHFYDIVYNQLKTENKDNALKSQDKVINQVISIYLEKDHSNIRPDFGPFLHATFYDENLDLEKILLVITQALNQETDNQSQLANSITAFLHQLNLPTNANNNSLLEEVNQIWAFYKALSDNQRSDIDLKAKDILIGSLYNWDGNPINKLNKIIIESDFFDIKRQFFDIINNSLPKYVTNLLLAKLILNTTPLFVQEYNSDIKLRKTRQFFKNLFKKELMRNKFLNRVIDATELKNQYYDNLTSYFPELILPEIKTLSSMDYTGPLRPLFATINEFKSLQPNQDNFFSNYIEHYLVVNKVQIDSLLKVEDFFKAFEKVLLERGNRRILELYAEVADGDYNYNDVANNSYRDFLNSFASTQNISDSIKNSWDSDNSDPHLLPLFYYPYLQITKNQEKPLFALKDNDSLNILRYLILASPYDHNASLNEFKNTVPEITEMQNYKDLSTYLDTIKNGFGSSTKPDAIRQVKYETVTDYVKSADIANITAQISSKIQHCEFTTYVSSKAFINSIQEPLTSPLQKIKDTILHPANNQSSSFAESYANSFQRWLFNSKEPLLVRQLVSLLNAIKNNNNNEEIQREVIVMSLLLNPWNDDSQVLKAFMFLLQEKIDDIIEGTISFNKMKELILLKIGHQIFGADITNAEILQNAILNGEMYFIEYKSESEETTTNEQPENQNETQNYVPYQCNKPAFCAEVESQIDRLIFSLSLMDKACEKGSDAYQSCQFFKMISFIKLIENDLIFFKEFSAKLQQEFVYELDIVYLMLSTLSCVDLCDIGDQFDNLDQYQNIQNKIDFRRQLFQYIQHFYDGKAITAYDIINRYTHKLVKSYNKVFERYATYRPVSFNKFSIKEKSTPFDFQYTLLPSLYLLTIDNQPDILHRFIEFMNPATIKSYNIEDGTIMQTVSRTIISFMPANNPKEMTSIDAGPQDSICALYYPQEIDFMGFSKELFNQSIFSRLDLNFEGQQITASTPISTKVLRVIVGSKFPADNENFTNFEVLAYLLMLFSDIPTEFYQRRPFYDVHLLSQLLLNRSKVTKKFVRGNSAIIDFLNKNCPEVISNSRPQFKKETQP